MRQPRARVPRFVGTGTKKYKDRARPLPRDCFSLRLILASCELRMRGLWARSVRWKACAFPFPGPTLRNARGRQSARIHPRSRPARRGSSFGMLTLVLRAALAKTERLKGLRARGFLHKWSVRPPASTAPTSKYDMQKCVLLASFHVWAKPDLRALVYQMLDSDDSLLREKVQLARCVGPRPHNRTIVS